jgi:ubiquinone/menaquinone biosynthesis C-methylase UbiE
MASQVEYTTVTELPGHNIHKEQLQRLFSRYHFAAEFSSDKDVLELGCGGGMGLGYLAKTARRVVGTDVDGQILRFPLEHYKDRANIEVRRMDAQKLDFADGSFDVVILFEAIYYLQDAGAFVAEAYRVLRPGGVLIVCTVNREWEEFNPSPHSVKYFSASELNSLLAGTFNQVDIYAAFPTESHSFKDKVIAAVKRTAVSLHLMPKTMKSKEFLKKMFFGKLTPMPAELTEKDCSHYQSPHSIDKTKSRSQDKIIYAVAGK